MAHARERRPKLLKAVILDVVIAFTWLNFHPGLRSRFSEGHPMSPGIWGERVERLLREPNNLFGPPKGEGYDYFKAAMTVAALALGAGSVLCRLTLESNPKVNPAFATLLGVAAAPAYVTLWFLWPFHLVVGWVVAVLVWFATLYGVACFTRWRACGQPARLALTTGAIIGWASGLIIAFVYARGLP